MSMISISTEYNPLFWRPARSECSAESEGSVEELWGRGWAVLWGLWVHDLSLSLFHLLSLCITIRLAMTLTRILPLSAQHAVHATNTWDVHVRLPSLCSMKRHINVVCVFCPPSPLILLISSLLIFIILFIDTDHDRDAPIAARGALWCPTRTMSVISGFRRFYHVYHLSIHLIIFNIFSYSPPTPLLSSKPPLYSHPRMSNRVAHLRILQWSQ